ncbi:YkvA family protein [Fictibacillus sp. WQ 8-8]|uniref:YkvA family protein n=1 Tax=Fictibacillus sp. WQ 8-8 TaxID=2938788 RepID=UPI002108626F|nr:YkvA family protein [Fictibacillus sp. WQ 8-8]MCQ6267032.1 YkvA family protein [Fictibacillus sp. WQ 8-8]
MERHTIGNYFNRMKSKASVILDDDHQTGELITNAEKKTESAQNNSSLRELTSQVKALIRLVKHYRDGSYRHVSKKSMILIVAALLYFVSPIDAVPDFLVGIGLLDDAAVLAFLYKTIKKEIDHYMEWEEEEQTIKPAP